VRRGPDHPAEEREDKEPFAAMRKSASAVEMAW
jgi:hypothetical protein